MRKRKTRRQKNEDLRRRYDSVKNLMSTFAMSTIAVVAAVVLIPASAKAEIIKTVALSDQIVYQVTVTDEEDALDLDTLTIVLENQLEYYEQPLLLGENSGFFDQLKFNTEYRLSVYGSKGFGRERLDTTFITTKEKIGSTILSVTPITDIHNTSYQIDISTYDPENKYSSIQLFYGYQMEPDGELIYNTEPILITENRQLVEVFDIWTETPFHIYVEGITVDGPVILDEIWVTPPFQLYASLYLAYYNNDEVVFHPFTDMRVENLEFEMKIYRNNQLIQTDSFIPSNNHNAHEKWIISNLNPDTAYIFECTAVFTNPQTLRTEKQIISTEEYTTTKNFTYTYLLNEKNNTLEVTVNLNDPENVLDIVYFEVLDTTLEFEEYLSGETYFFDIDGEDKFYTFTIILPNVEKYQINIGMRSNTNSYVNEIIEIIEKSREE